MRSEARREPHNGDTHNRHGRRAQRKTADDAVSGDNESPNSAPDTQRTQDASQPPFQAILSDVLPPDGQGGGDDGHGDPGNATFQVDPLGPGFPAGKDQVAVVAKMAQDQAAPAIESPSGKADAKPATEADPGLAIKADPGLAIKKDTIGGVRAEVNPKSVERGELAFAARIAGRSAAVAALDPGHGQGAIAASRFDSLGTGGHASAQDHKDPNIVLPGKNNPDAAAEADAKPQSQAADNQDSAAIDKQPAGATQDAGVRAVGASAQSHATGAESAASARAGTSAATSAGASQDAVAGLTAAASGPAGAAGAGSASGKQAAESRAPQFLEPQAETPGHTGDSVRDISLRLSGKDQSSVQVRLSERGGELQVSVRTPDTGLTRGLREGLTDLVGRLEHNGYRTETWQPADSGSSGRDSQDSPSHGGSSHENGGDANRGAGHQQNSPDQQPDSQTPKWVRELDSSLQRSNSSWLPSAR